VMMGHKEELVFLGRDLGEQRNYSEEQAAVIDEEIKGIIDGAHETARKILTEHRVQMDRVVERLQVVETIDSAELEAILAGSRGSAAAQVS
jgi:cell division protease FtsH